MFVKFFYNAENDGTGEDGLPKYKSEVYVEIHMDSTNVFIGKASEEHKQRFPQIYEAFLKASEKPEVDGFPLEMWVRMSPSDVMNCRARGIYTVQQLANLGTVGIPGVMSEHVLAAKSFIQIAGQGAVDMEMIEKLRSENDNLREQITALKRQVAKLTEKADAA